MSRERCLPMVVRLPAWVPIAVRNYLMHTETGLPIRTLARANDCHASTIMRQIRRYENRRDDPLMDDALRRLTPFVPPRQPPPGKDRPRMDVDLRTDPHPLDEDMSEARITREGARILRRLCETGAVLAVARDMDMSVVVRDLPDGSSTRTAVVEARLAQALALRDWIACADTGARIARYRITSAGRVALKEMLAVAENRAMGFGEAQAEFTQKGRIWDEGDDDPRRQHRYGAIESPLAGLARRKDRDGKPFLSRDLVAVGERLREDFELTQMGPNVTQNWERFLTAPDPRKTCGTAATGSAAAKERVIAALSDLGPGLGDVVLRCCCFLEGLEQTEKYMGWAARSGKIVLRIALQRLKQHYAAQGKYGPKIG